MGAEVCISDCSLLNQTTCQPVSRRQVQVQAADILVLTSDEDGCHTMPVPVHLGV